MKVGACFGGPDKRVAITGADEIKKNATTAAAAADGLLKDRPKALAIVVREVAYGCRGTRPAPRRKRVRANRAATVAQQHALARAQKHAAGGARTLLLVKLKKVEKLALSVAPCAAKGLRGGLESAGKRAATLANRLPLKTRPRVAIAALVKGVT